MPTTVRSRSVRSVAAAVPAGPAPASPVHPHWQGLDGLRAVAVAAVVVYHFFPAALPGGFLGVDVFFVISGYLITRLLVRERLRSARIDIPSFYLRRARRLLPALVLLLATVSAAAVIWRDQLATLRSGVLATAAFGGNWWLAESHQPYFVAVGRPSMLQHLWSLGVEEQFYLFWPLVLAIVLAAVARSTAGLPDSAQRLRRGVSRVGVVALMGALAATGLTWALADLRNVPYGNDGSSLYYGTDTHCMGLLLGAALAAATVTLGGEEKLAGLGPRVSRAIDAAGYAAVAGLGWLLWWLSEYNLMLYRGGLLLVSAVVAVVIAAAARPGSRLGAALEHPWLRWVGVRSYSIYLWHWPIAVVTRPGLDTSLPTWFDQALRLGLTLVLADLSYRYVETPVRRLGFRAAGRLLAQRLRAGWRRLPPARAVVATGSFAAIALVGLGVLVVGPAAPRPPASFATGAGGRHLSLHQPRSTLTSSGHRGSNAPDPRSRPPVRHPARLPRISGFGDSVLLGARGALAQVFPGGSIDAVEGRQPGPILADVRAAARAGRLHPLVILHVGNNGLIDPADLTRTLQALSGVRLVLVLTDHIDAYTHPWQDANNAVIDRIVPRFPNARVVRWNQIVSAHPGWLYPDGVHLRPAGAHAYAHLLAAAWRAAMRAPTP